MSTRKALLVAAALLPAAPRAAEEPPLFLVRVQVQRVDEGAGVVTAEAGRPDLAGAKVSLREEVAIDLSFQAGATLRPLRSSFSSSYAWKRNVVHTRESRAEREESGAEAGTRLLDWDAVIERTYRPLSCEDLVVHDQVGDGKGARSVETGPAAGTASVRLRLVASWPGKIRLRDASAGLAPFVEDSLPSLDLERTFPYELRYAEARHRAAFETSLPAAEPMPAVDRRWNVEWSLAPIEPHEFGLTARTDAAGPPELVNRIVVGGRNVSRGLRVRRMERWWAVREAPGGPAAYELASDWRAFTDDGARPAPPELFQEPPEEPKAPDRKWLVEFLEMVDGLPELGLLYHTVTIETHAAEPRHRFVASEARPVSSATWCDIRGRSAPGMDAPELASSGPLRVIVEKTYGSSGIAAR